MAYTPINWQTGDTITAEKLNKMDNGWGVDSAQLFSETVTTEVDEYAPDDPATAPLSYATQITADTLIVTFDGVDYTCPKSALGASAAYGGMSDSGPDFTSYPFAITSASIPLVGVSNTIYTQTAGTHAVSASGVAIETSSNFRSAVLSIGAMPMLCVSGTTTYDEMDAAKSANRFMYFYDSHGRCAIVADMTSAPIGITPAYSDLTVEFDSDNIFTVTAS